MLIISNSGLTTEIVRLIELSKKMHPHIKLIALTKKQDSQLAEMADMVVLTGQTNEICPLNLTPTTSTTVMKVIGDLLVVTLMKKINFEKDMYALT